MNKVFLPCEYSPLEKILNFKLSGLSLDTLKILMNSLLKVKLQYQAKRYKKYKIEVFDSYIILYLQISGYF